MMKALITPALLISVSMIFMACPFGSPYALEQEPKEKVKTALLGRWIWVNEKDSASYTIELSKKTDYEYKITVRGDLRKLINTWTPEKDSINVTGFTSTVDGNLFLNVSTQGQFYLVHVKLQDGLLSLLPLSDQFTGDLIRNNQALKQMVSTYMKNQYPLYDELTSVKGMVKQTPVK